MKKKILGAVVAVAIAAVAVMYMDLVSSPKQQALSAIHLANIEALALGEGGDGKDNCSKQCKDDSDYTCITPYGLIKNQKCAD